MYTIWTPECSYCVLLSVVGSDFKGKLVFKIFRLSRITGSTYIFQNQKKDWSQNNEKLLYSPDVFTVLCE